MGGPPSDDEECLCQDKDPRETFSPRSSSFFIPGLGQLFQGRLIMAVFQFVLAGILWFFLLGWVIHLWSVLDAALWKAKA